MDNLLTIKKDEIYVATDILAKELERKHQTIYNLVKTYKEEIETLGVLTFEIRKPNNEKGGQPVKFYYLNEEQYIFLITNMRTKANEKSTVMRKKIEISKQFVKMRKTLLNLATQKANQEWLETRSKGKISRLKETDTIKNFIEHAKNQGSKNADKYYITLTNMENKALFLIEQKFKNLREILNINQLDEIKQADEIVLKALNDGMNENMHYKDIYKLAKKRVELFASLKGQSVVPSMEFKQLHISKEVIK